MHGTLLLCKNLKTVWSEVSLNAKQIFTKALKYSVKCLYLKDISTEDL